MRYYYICFSIFHCLLVQKKKMETEKWPKGANSSHITLENFSGRLNE